MSRKLWMTALASSAMALTLAAGSTARANTYAGNPAALQLRAMNIIYETTKERGATILMPTAMVDAMNPGGVLGLAALAQSSAQPPAAAASG